MIYSNPQTDRQVGNLEIYGNMMKYEVITIYFHFGRVSIFLGINMMYWCILVHIGVANHGHHWGPTALDF
jgi:hypothetical protein